MLAKEREGEEEDGACIHVEWSAAAGSLSLDVTGRRLVRRQGQRVAATRRSPPRLLLELCCGAGVAAALEPSGLSVVAATTLPLAGSASFANGMAQWVPLQPHGRVLITLHSALYA